MADLTPHQQEVIDTLRRDVDDTIKAVRAIHKSMQETNHLLVILEFEVKKSRLVPLGEVLEAIDSAELEFSAGDSRLNIGYIREQLSIQVQEKLGVKP